MKRIIALILASLMMLFSFCSCGEKKEKVDLASIIVAKTEHYEIDGAMYAFFLYDFVGQYSSYLTYYGYDLTKTLSEQTSECTISEGQTWFEFFADMANSQIDQYLSQCEAAYEESFALKDEELEEIASYISELQADAVEDGYKDLDELLAEYYIGGITAEVFEKCITMQQLAYSYMNARSEQIEYTDDDLEKYRIEHPEEFLMIDVIQYGFFAEYEDDATDEEKAAAISDAKAKADNFVNANKTLDEVKNAIFELEKKDENDTLAEVISDYLLDSNLYDAELASDEAYKPYYDWAYSSERKAGDSFVYEETASTGETYYIVSTIVSPADYNKYLTKDCRHILFYVDTSETDTEKLATAKSEALGLANIILGEFNDGNKTEEEFIALETKCLADESALEATAYYNVTQGYMVTEFENWIYGERTPGDCEIVETEYGYHVVYFIGDGLPAWKIDAKTGFVSEIMTEYQNELMETYKVSYDSKELKKIP